MTQTSHSDLILPPDWARTELDAAAPAEYETATFALG